MQGNAVQGDAEQIFVKVLEIANHFLTQGIHVGLSVMKKKVNPSFEELANILTVLANVVDTIYYEDEICPHLYNKVIEYTSIVKKMSVAIKNNNQEDFDDLLAELDRKPFC